MLNEKRVLVVIRWPVGGIRTHILYMYPLLLRAGYRFSFVGPYDSSFSLLQKDLAQWDGTEFFPAPVEQHPSAIRRVVRTLLRERRFALLHSHGITAISQCVFANLGIGVSHVATSHGVIRRDREFPGAIGSIKRWGLSYILSRVNVFVTVSHDARANHAVHLPYLSSGPCELTTILNGVDLRRLDDDPLGEPYDLRRALGIGGSPLLVGFVGRFEEEKGFDILLSALDQLVSRHPDFSFVLAAIGRVQCPRRYQDLLANRPAVARCVKFLEHTPNVAPLLRQLDILVMPSISEACPLLPMEAMCVGLPVLGSDCIGLREILGGTPSRMIPVGDASTLASALLNSAQPDWKSRARAYAPQARQRFDVGPRSLELLSVYERLIARTFSPASERPNSFQTPSAKHTPDV